jgi:hypothetical protein
MQFGFVVLGTALALYRIPPRQELRSLWAEDGQIFVQQAHLSGFFHTLVTPYAGYLHFVPRIVAGVSTLFPLRDSSAIVNASTAVLHGLLALLVWHALRDVIHHPVLRLVPPLLVCSAPVGAETAVSLANMQWTLQIAATVVAAFWKPRHKAGIALGAAVLVLTALSTPFGFVLVLVCALRLWRSHWRSLTAWSFLTAATMATALQGVAMADARTRLHKSASLMSLPVRYLRRVVGQVFIGDNTAAQVSAATTLAFGCLVAVALVFVAVTLWRNRASGASAARTSLVRGAVLLMASVLFFFAPVYLKPPAVNQALAGSRYSLAPAVLLIAAFCVVVDSLIRLVPSERVSEKAFQAAKGTSAVLFGLLAIAVVSSHEGALSHRRVDDWPATVRQASAQCRRESGSKLVALQISPGKWHVTLPCSKVI